MHPRAPGNQNDDEHWLLKDPPQYNREFKWLGCLSKLYHITVNPEVTPIVYPLGNQLVAIRDAIR